MKACVIGDREPPNGPPNLAIFKGLKDIRKFESVFFAPPDQIKIGIKDCKESIVHREKDLTKFDVVIPRLFNKNLLFEYSLVKCLTSGNTYVPFSPESMLITSDKYLTLELLSRAKLPVPDTFLTMSPETGKRIVKDMNFPLVMKLPQVEGGVGVVFSEKEENAVSLIDTFNVLRQPLFIQSYLKNPDQSIEKAIVIGDDVVASIKETSQNGDKRSNIPFGKASPTVLDKRSKKIAIKTAKVLGADICEVDLVETPEGRRYIIEANLQLNVKTWSEVTGIDLVRKIAEFVASRAEKGIGHRIVHMSSFIGKQFKIKK